MDTSFWHKKWKENNIGFHESKANPLLVKYFKGHSLAKGGRVFLPLCGKTLDIPWLLSNGYRVAGSELSELAIEQLFMELGMKPNISRSDEITHYSKKNLDIFVGDIFHLSRNILGQVDAVYDRAALVALPHDIRKQYTTHLMGVTGKAPQLLISYEYDQICMEGPPFSVSNAEIKKHYKNIYNLTLIVSINVPGGLKGKCEAKENVWLLQNK